MISVVIPNHNEENIHQVISDIEKVLQYYEVEIIIAVDREARGKGWAVRQAVNESKGDVVVFIDGDGDINPKMILRLLPHLNEFDIVVGKKDVHKMISRWMITILSRLYIRLFFGIKVDTQTGIKVFKRKALPDWETDGFAFDIEILAKAKLQNINMYEVTVEANVLRKMSQTAILKTFLDSIKIWIKLKEK